MLYHYNILNKWCVNLFIKLLIISNGSIYGEMYLTVNSVLSGDISFIIRLLSVGLVNISFL